MSDKLMSSTVVLENYLRDPTCDESARTFDRKYRPRVVARCLRCGLQPSDAEDVASEVLLAFFRQAMQVKFVFIDKRRFGAWLRTVTTNEVRDYLDRRTRPGARGLGDGLSDRLLEQIHEGLESLWAPDLELGVRAMDAVRAKVKPHSWEAFVATALEDRNPDEVAAELGMDIGAVYKTRSRIAQMCRDEYARLAAGDAPARGTREAPE